MWYCSTCPECSTPCSMSTDLNIRTSAIASRAVAGSHSSPMLAMSFSHSCSKSETATTRCSASEAFEADFFVTAGRGVRSSWVISVSSGMAIKAVGKGRSSTEDAGAGPDAAVLAVWVSGSGVPALPPPVNSLCLLLTSSWRSSMSRRAAARPSNIFDVARSRLVAVSSISK